MEVLVENLTFLTWQQVLMWLIGGVLIYLAIVKEMEPSLLLPMGFGAILVNLPNSGAAEVIAHLFELGIAGHELFPLLLLIGTGSDDRFPAAAWQIQSCDLWSGGAFGFSSRWGWRPYWDLN